MTEKQDVCEYTGKKGYVKDEDCHCFCCGTHKPKEETCENCGHVANAVCHYSPHFAGECPCKKYKAKNHSPEIVQPRDSSTAGKKPHGRVSRHVEKVQGTFNLSEKRVGYKGFYHYPEEDVKEFIRRLKEHSVETHDCDENCKGDGACEIAESLIIRKDFLNKLAGDDLR